MFFSYYQNVNSYDPVQSTIWELSDIITSESIQQSTIQVKELKKAKKDLPIIIPSVTMNSGKKNKENILKHSGLIWFDIDLKDNLDIQNKLNKINNDKYTYFTWSSINGGIRIVVYTECNSIDNHINYWNELSKYYSDKYDIIIDPKPKSPNSFCFINYDENIYENSFSEKYKLKNTYSTTVDTFSGSTKKNVSTTVDTFSEDKPLKYKHYVDEELFNGDYQKPIYIEGGIKVIDLKLFNDYKIKEGNRNRIIAYISMVLLYNNTDVTLNRLTKEMYSINNRYCEPPMPPKEVKDIVLGNYNKHITTGINFEPYKKTKYIFYSKHFKGIELTDEQIKELDSDLLYNPDKKKEMMRINKIRLSMKALKEGNSLSKQQMIYDVIESSDRKLTYKEIAKELNLSEVTIKRYMTPELKEFNMLKNVKK